jgi:hypothetical protein
MTAMRPSGEPWSPFSQRRSVSSMRSDYCFVIFAPDGSRNADAGGDDV